MKPVIFFLQSRVFLFYSKNRQGLCVPVTLGAQVTRGKLVPVRITDSQTPHESAEK